MAELPLTSAHAREFLRLEAASKSKSDFHSRTQRKRVAVEKSQIEAPTPKNTYGFKHTYNVSDSQAPNECDFLTVLSAEIHGNFFGGHYITSYCCYSQRPRQTLSRPDV